MLRAQRARRCTVVRNATRSVQLQRVQHYHAAAPARVPTVHVFASRRLVAFLANSQVTFAGFVKRAHLAAHVKGFAQAGYNTYAPLTDIATTAHLETVNATVNQGTP